MRLRAVCTKGPFEESEVKARLRCRVMWLNLRDLSQVAMIIAFLVLLLKRPDSVAITIKLNLRRSLGTSFGTPIPMAFMPWLVSLESEIDGHLRYLYSSEFEGGPVWGQTLIGGSWVVNSPLLPSHLPKV